MTNATPQVISDILDQALVSIKAQISALNFADLNTTTTSTTSTTSTVKPTTTSTTTTSTSKPTTTTSTTTTSTTSNGTIVVGGTNSGPVTLKPNTTYSGLTIDLGKTSSTAFIGSNVTNVTIKNCKIINGTGTATAVYITGGSNITITGNLIANIPQGIVIKNTTSNVLIDSNQFQNILNSPSLTMHPIQFQSVNGVGNKITNNRIEEIASVAPYTHDQISIYQSNGIATDSIEIAYNWIRGGQQVKNAAGNNGACAIGVGDSGGSYQSVHDNIMVNALGIAVDGSGTSLNIFNNKTYAKQVSPQPLSGPMVYFGNAGNNIMQNNTYNFTGPNGQLVSANFSMVKGTLTGQSTNIYNSTITANILPTTIITMK